MKQRKSAFETIWYRGNELASVPICEASKRVVKLMEEDYIELHFSLAKATYFPLGAYCDDELFGRFYVTKEQMPKYNTSTGGYDYELKMEAWYRVWAQKIFMCVSTEIETGKEFRKNAEWYLTASLKEQMREFLVNLQLCGYVSESYNFRKDDVDLAKFIYIHSADIPSYAQSLALTYDKQNLLDVLKTLAETWDCEWWVVGNEENFVIHFGKCEVGDAKTLELGVNVERIEANNDMSDAGTKLFCFGSEENIPNTYRKELSLVMGNCRGRYFNAYYENGSGTKEKLDFGGTRKNGVITDGLIPYGTEVRLRLKGNNTGLSKIYDVKAQVGVDAGSHVYSRFFEKFPDNTLPLIYIRDYRVSIEAKFGDEVIKVVDKTTEDRYQKLRDGGNVAPDRLRYICEVGVCEYRNEEWVTIGYFPYALSHSQWYDWSKKSGFLEINTHGEYDEHADFHLWQNSTAMTFAMPKKNGGGTYTGMLSEYLECTNGLGVPTELQRYVEMFDWRLVTTQIDVNFRLCNNMDISAEALTWWEGEENNTYSLGKRFNANGGEDFDEYQISIYLNEVASVSTTGGLPLWMWIEYAKSTTFLQWDESTQTFLLDNAITLRLSGDGLTLVSDRIMWAEKPHQFSEGVDVDVSKNYQYNVTLVTQVAQSQYCYYLWNEDESEFEKIYEVTLTDSENGGLLANQKKKNELSRDGRTDIIRLNSCADMDAAQYETMHISCIDQKPQVRVGIRNVAGAATVGVTLSYNMGVANTLDAIDSDNAYGSDYYVRLVNGTANKTLTALNGAGTLTYATFELPITAAERDATATFTQTARVVPLLYLSATVVYRDSGGNVIQLNDVIDKSVSGKIEVLPETDDNPTFQFQIQGTAFIIKAKVAKFDLLYPDEPGVNTLVGRDFAVQEYGTDFSFVKDGTEFVLVTDEDYRVPYKYYVNAIDDPSSVLGISTKRLQMPVFNSEEYEQYKDKYNLGLIYDNSGGEWMTRGRWAYRNGMILPVEYINDPQSNELQELCITTDNIYPMAKFLVSSVRTTDEKEISDVDGESKSDAVTWYWKQYHITLMLANGDPVTFSQSYIREVGAKLKLRFLVPEDVKDYADNGTLAADYNEILKGCKLAGMTFEDEFNDKIGEHEQDHAIARNEDFGAKLPNDTLYPSKYDPVTLLNWNVRAMASMGLIPSAEYSLLDYALQYIDALNEGNFTFDVTMISNDNEEWGVTGQKVIVKHAALKQDKATRVIGYELKLDYPYDSPTLTCGETDAYSRLKMLEKGIRELKSPVIQNSYYSSTGLTKADFGDGYTMEIDQDKGGFLAPRETETVTCTIYDALGKDVTSTFVNWSIARDSGDKASDAVWNTAHQVATNPFSLSFADLNIDGINITAAKFTVTATDATNEETATTQLDFFI